MVVVKGTSDDKSGTPQINNSQGIIRKEFCEKCKAILDKLFTERLLALNSINEEIERLFKLSSHKRDNT